MSGEIVNQKHSAASLPIKRSGGVALEMNLNGKLHTGDKTSV